MFARILTGIVRGRCVRRVAGVCIALALAAPLASFGSPLTVTDDAGRTVTLAAPARRIISLAPHLTAILFALGVGDDIVSVSRYSDYPPAAKKIPRLGDAFSVSVEAVVALRPDIVFAWRSGGSDRALTRIQSLGIPVYFNSAKTLFDIARSVEKIAVLVGKPALGKTLAQRFRDQLARLHRKPGPRPVRVFFQISDQSLYTVNGKHLIGQAITWCGGVNVFADARISVPMVSKEAVLAASPDLILITRVKGRPPSPWVARWNDYPSLRGKVASIDPNLISRPGLRMVQGIARMCELIQQAGRQADKR